MLSLSSLIEFLLDLLRDPDAADEFARDPQGVLAANGLSGLTAADVRDVAPLLADQPGVGLCRPPGDDHDDRHHQVASRHEHVAHHRAQHDDDPVQAIHHVRTQYVVERHDVHHTPQHHTVEHHQHHEFSYTHVDNSIHAAEGATVAVDSFNQDNDGVDNKGGTIDDSVVAGRDANGSGNTTEQTVVEDSFNTDETSTVTDSGNTTTTVAVTDSGNDESVEVEESFNTDAGTTVQDSFAGTTVNDSYAVEDPLAAVPAGAATGAETAA